jgi:aarF domain-containing kinase
VDLTTEASNLQRFKDCFSLWPSVSFPTPVLGLATEQVLVETFEVGTLGLTVKGLGSRV